MYDHQREWPDLATGSKRNTELSDHLAPNTIVPRRRHLWVHRWLDVLISPYRALPISQVRLDFTEDRLVARRHGWYGLRRIANPRGYRVESHTITASILNSRTVIASPLCLVGCPKGTRRHDNFLTLKAVTAGRTDQFSSDAVSRFLWQTTEPRYVTQ